MTLPSDAISKRKLVLVKQLYQLGLEQSKLTYSIINRITSTINFDLAIETLLKVAIDALGKQPNDNFPGLLDLYDRLGNAAGLPVVPHRSKILYMHSIRNDAQHKAKYPNEIDISDFRIYTREFCQDFIKNVWNLSFDDISQIDLIDDTLLQNFLNEAQVYIAQDNYSKSVILSSSAFSFASRCVSSIIPKPDAQIYNNSNPELKPLVKDISNAIFGTAKNSIYYAALFSSGISLISYKQYLDISPSRQITTQRDISNPNKSSTIIYVYWNNKTPSKDDALWIFNFTINSVINWQHLGLRPNISGDNIEYAKLLTDFGDNVKERP